MGRVGIEDVRDRERKRDPAAPVSPIRRLYSVAGRADRDLVLTQHTVSRQIGAATMAAMIFAVKEMAHNSNSCVAETPRALSWESGVGDYGVVSGMPSARRMGSENAENRLKLIEAAVLIARKHGFASLTASVLAKMVGLKRKIVHYYFASMSDLIIAVIRHEADGFRRHFTEAMSGDEPLRKTLALAVEGTPISYELMAMALKNKAIAAELKHDAEALREIETEALVLNLKTQGIRPEVPPIATAFVLRATIQALAIEAELGVSLGHAETQVFIEEWLQSFTTAGRLPYADRKKSQPENRKRKTGSIPRVFSRQSRTPVSKLNP